MSLYIGTASASSELSDSPLSQAITLLAATIAINTRHGMVPDGPSLDVTFMLPGKFEKPEFTGMRMGNYTEKANTLFFERAVPEEMLFSPRAKEYVAIVMQDVIYQAGIFFNEKNIAFDIAKWEDLINSLADEMKHTTTTEIKGLMTQ